MINDDFGDPAPPIDDIIASKWVEGMVRGVTGREDEDLAQEARLAMWKAAPRWDGRGTLHGYLHTTARYRVKSLLAGDHLYTGQEKPNSGGTQRRGDEARARLRTVIADFTREHGRAPSSQEAANILGIGVQAVNKQKRTMHHTPTDVQAKVNSLDALIEAYGTEAVFEAADLYEGIVLAYHHGEIYEAVADLDPIRREYVFLRFWCGMTGTEAQSTVGVKVHWERDVRPVLRERLEHLAGAL